MKTTQILVMMILGATAATSFAATKTAPTTEEPKVIVSTQELPVNDNPAMSASADQPAASEVAVVEETKATKKTSK